MALVGYARSSLVGPSLAVQCEKLHRCHKIFHEKEGEASSKQPELVACLDYLRRDDILVVTHLDRLARSTFHLCQIIAKLKDKQVSLRVLDQDIDTDNPAGRSFLKMLETIAQFEREIRADRQLEGVQKAKARGVSFGRKRQLTSAQVSELKQKRKEGVLIKDLMQEYGLVKSTIYRYLDGTSPNP